MDEGEQEAHKVRTRISLAYLTVFKNENFFLPFQIPPEKPLHLPLLRLLADFHPQLPAIHRAVPGREINFKIVFPIFVNAIFVRPPTSAPTTRSTSYSQTTHGEKEIDL